MKKVTFARARDEKTKEVFLRFSFGYLLLGPIYYLLKVMIVRGVLLTLLYAVLIYPKSFELIKMGLVRVGVPEGNLAFLDKVGGMYWWLIGALVVIHVLLAFITPRAVVKKLLRNGFVPYCEIDTQMLIKHNLAKVGTLCYLSSFKPINGVQGKIPMGNSKDLDKELEELKELLKEGMITKDEYETKRAEAIMRKSKKKK